MSGLSPNWRLSLFSPNLLMIPLLILWLCCVHFTNQEICSSPGNFPAPQLFLEKTSGKEGDIILLKCKVPALSTFSRVIFCKDGKDLGSWPMQENKFAYNHQVRANSTGRFTCLYQHKDDRNQERNSFLSATQNLDARDATSNRNGSGVQLFSNENMYVLRLVLDDKILLDILILGFMLIVILIAFLIFHCKAGNINLSTLRHAKLILLIIAVLSLLALIIIGAIFLTCRCSGHLDMPKLFLTFNILVGVASVPLFILIPFLISYCYLGRCSKAESGHAPCSSSSPGNV